MAIQKLDMCAWILESSIYYGTSQKGKVDKQNRTGNWEKLPDVSSLSQSILVKLIFSITCLFISCFFTARAFFFSLLPACPLLLLELWLND